MRIETGLSRAARTKEYYEREAKERLATKRCHSEPVNLPEAIGKSIFEKPTRGESYVFIGFEN